MRRFLLRLHLFWDLIGIQGYDGRPTTIREAWEIADPLRRRRA